MKILHVVTLHSADNAFGGPVRVALNLAAELNDKGNSVVILAGSKGIPKTDIIEGVPCQLFPVHSIHARLGFSGMFSWKLWVWTWRKVTDFDVVHIHLARDLITLPVGLIAVVRGIPFVIQGHGMIDPTSKFLGRILDGLATRRLLRRAKRILYLTPTEEKDIKAVSRDQHAELSFLPNGVPESDVDRIQNAKFISFISRLQDRKNPDKFVEMASILGDENNEYEFRIAGADEGKLAHTLKAIRETTLGDRISYLGALDHSGVLKLLTQTKILVLPSVNEPFPMIILEALSMSVPVVITETCGLSPYISKSGAGMVTNGSPEDLALAVRTMCADLELYSNRAVQLSRADFSMSQIVGQLKHVYALAMK